VENAKKLAMDIFKIASRLDMKLESEKHGKRIIKEL
jgi:hypothetical protein